MYFRSAARSRLRGYHRQIVSSIQTILLNTLINSFITIIYPPLSVESHHYGHLYPITAAKSRIPLYTAVTKTTQPRRGCHISMATNNDRAVLSPWWPQVSLRCQLHRSHSSHPNPSELNENGCFERDVFLVECKRPSSDTTESNWSDTVNNQFREDLSSTSERF